MSHKKQQIFDIYSRYKIPPNLQQHMLWTAALGNIISSSWKEKGSVDVGRVTQTLLIHDMTNIVLFDLDKFPIDFDKFSHLLKEEERNHDYWKNVQKEFIKKYGEDEHTAVIEIARELGLGEKAIEILDRMPQVNSQNTISEDDWELKICFYSDFRVAPDGIMSIEKRTDELIERQRVKGYGLDEIQRLESIKKYCISLEKQIQQNVTEDIVSIEENVIQSVMDRVARYSF